jgi:hypothetical protein
VAGGSQMVKTWQNKDRAHAMARSPKAQSDRKDPVPRGHAGMGSQAKGVDKGRGT